jgi:hypothetical protein
VCRGCPKTYIDRARNPLVGSLQQAPKQQFAGCHTKGFHALTVHIDEAAADACFEVFGIDEGAMGEAMTLQVAPGEFDVVEFGRVCRQPLDREPGTGGERLGGEPAGVDRTVVEDEHRRPRCPARLRPEAAVDDLEERHEVGAALGCEVCTISSRVAASCIPIMAAF